MSLPVFSAYSASFVATIEMPHIYDDRARIQPPGWNGRPAMVRLAIPQKLKMRSRREGQRKSDDSDPSRNVLPTTDLYVYTVKIMMPGSAGMRDVDIGVTTEPDAIKALAAAQKP